jgi:hypothetical protein
MSALAKIQRDFCQFVLGHGHKDFLQHIKVTTHSDEVLLNVYHNNVLSVHARSLKNKYPLVFSIMGEAAARIMVRSYIESSFPCTGSLEEWGAGLIPFIQRYERASAWPYLAEIAQFEWAQNIAYIAPEDPLLTPEDMKRLIAPDQKEVNFHFQKSCQLLAFLHPLEEIIAAHRKDSAQPHTDKTGTSYALILKHQGLIKVYWLTASLFVFINRLIEGQDVEVAFAAAQVLEPKFDAQEAFSFLLSHPILHQ